MDWTPEKGIVNCWRGCMATYARLWKAIRRDPLERERALLYLSEAVRCREKARELSICYGLIAN
jgi:hypothetical protein